MNDAPGTRTNPTRRPPVKVHPESRPAMTGPDPEPATGSPPRLLVTLATYNEAGNLRPLVEAIREQAPGAAVLVIDDNSPDGTGAIADELVAALPDVHVIHRAGKLGLGTAIIEGIEFAIAGGYDYLLNVDADFSHPPRFIPSLVAGMRDHDVMIGSRYVPGGGFEGGQFDLKRKFMSTGINLYARLFLGLPSKDNSGAFRCYRVSKLAAIDVRKRVRSRGYSFMEEILFWCRQVGCRIGETPIIFENRRAGVSKINKYEAYMALRIIFELGVGRALGTARVEPAPAEAAVPPAPHVARGGGASTS
jgi:dolichol-phosphate mannosyltransferase